MDFFIPVITIIGFGETGAIIGSLVNHGKHNIKINIMDPDEAVEGRILDLEHAAISKNNEIHWNNKSLLKKSQLIFYTAGVRGEAGQSRSEKAEENLKIIKNVFENQELKSSALIVSISNPVEAIAQWIHETIKCKCTVLSTGTLLDTYRLRAILSKHFNMSTSFIETLVIGEHGSTMFPLWSQTKIKNKNISKLVDDDQLAIFTETLKNTASEIRKTQPATKYGVAQTAITLANQYFARQSVLMPIAFSSKEFVKDDIFVNWPCFVGKQHVLPNTMRLTTGEQELWEKAVNSIHKTTTINTVN